MSILYYTVEKQLRSGDDCVNISETTGWKTIRIYRIEDSIPKLIAEIEALLITSSINEIETWLDNNDDNTEYEFIEL